MNSEEGPRFQTLNALIEKKMGTIIPAGLPVAMREDVEMCRELPGAPLTNLPSTNISVVLHIWIIRTLLASLNSSLVVNLLLGLLLSHSNLQDTRIR